jgi:DUF1009 family protein
MRTLGLIAGRGVYPAEWLQAARAAGPARIFMAAFHGETSPDLADAVDGVEWMRVGQLGRLFKFFQGAGVKEAVMAGQITPGNLFDLRPDMQALLLLARLKERNAASLFGAIADALSQRGIELLPATTFMEDRLPQSGWRIGPRPARATLHDLEFGWKMAKETSRLDIGQTVVVRAGTVLAVEAFEGTNDAMRRGGSLGKGRGVVVKVSKPEQDMRFDVPVIGPRTLEVAAESGLTAIGIEAKKTLLLEAQKLSHLAESLNITVMALGE